MQPITPANTRATLQTTCQCAGKVEMARFIEDFTACRRFALEPPARLPPPDGGRPK